MAGDHGRLLATAAVGIPGIHNPAANETGAGRSCDPFGLNMSDPNNTLYHTWYKINCVSTFTVDSQIFVTMWTTAAVGVLCLAVFCWGQSFCSVYRGRLLSPSVAIKPPVPSNRNFFAKYFAWLWITITMSENELLATAGMDALMLERLIIFCLQFMFPVMVVAVSTLIPIHMSSKYLADNTTSGQNFAKSNLMALTMGNLEPEAKTLWVHFVFVVLFTAYGMWLLDQHYKSYVLLRQQYLTRGDSVSPWLGPTHVPKQKPLSSYGSVLLDQTTQQELFNPLWTFARAKASDSDTGTRNPPSKAPSVAAAAADSTPAEGQQGAAVLSKLASLQPSRDGADGPQAATQHGQQQREQQQRRQQQAVVGRTAADESPFESSADVTARAQAAASPFASIEEQAVLQQQDTLRMVQVTDIVFPAAVQAEEPSLQEEQSTLGSLPRQHSAALTQQPGLDRSAAASPSGSSSAPGSQLVSRQSSGRALLGGGKHVDSSSAADLLTAEQAAPQQQRGRFGFLQRASKGQKQQQHSATATAAPAGDEAVYLESADGAVSHGGGRARRRFSACGPGGCTWSRLDCRSTDSDVPAVSFEVDVDAAVAAAEAERQELRQRRAKQRVAERAAAARAAEQLGADVEWWQHRTGDVLLDRHVVRVDMGKELGSAGHDPHMPFYWWQLAPADALSTSGGADPSSSGAGGHSAAGTGSNLQPVPGTSLLFDRRSLRARRPSVRFRNTVHVLSQDGSLVPLHVSTYAVLVTDVPEVQQLRRNSSASSSGCTDGFGPGTSCCGPFAEACSSLVDALDHALQFVCWGWPCLLSRAELKEHTKAWIKLSFKSTQSFIVREASQRLEHLESGALLEDFAAAGATGQQQQQGPQQQADMQRTLRQRQRSMLKVPVTRQELVELTFKQLFPDDVQAVIPAQEYKAVNELLREWNRKLQVYIHTAGLCELKKQRQQRKKEKERQQAAADGDGAGAGQPDSAASAEQVCIKVADVQDRAAPAAHAGQAAAAGASSSGSSSASSMPAGGGDSKGNGARSPSAAPQQPAGMVRQGRHSRHSSACSSDYDLSDGDEELGCCAATARRLCCCACCGVGAFQAGGHGLSPPEGDLQDGRAGSGSCGSSLCCGLFGCCQREQELPKASRDVLAAKREEILELEGKIREEQAKVLAGPDTGNFIVLFKTPQAANLAANSTVYPDAGDESQGEPFKVQPAPSPEDVLWPSLWASPADRRSVLGVVTFWYAILYLVPTGFFTASLNAVNLTMCSHNSSPAFTRSFEWFCSSWFLQFLVTIVTPYILLIVWQNAVIPAQMYRLELRRAVAVSLSQMERRLLLAYCGWELTNLFLGGVLSGSLVSQLQVFIEHPERWAQILGAAIPQTSNYFLNFVLIRAFMLNLVRLLMPHGGMWRWLGQMLFTGFTSFRHAATASYRACIIYPASIRQGREPGLILLILLIGMAYCVAAPLLTVFVFAYMVTAYVVWRYQIIYVCVRAYESGGKMWPTYFLCIEYCLGFFVAFTSSMLIFKKANIQGVLVLLLLPALYIFNRRCRHKYRAKVDHPPLWLAHTAPRSEIDPLVYLPPCLQPNAQGWFFEAGKPWIRWGVPSYNNPNKPGHDAGSLCCA